MYIKSLSYPTKKRIGQFCDQRKFLPPSKWGGRKVKATKARGCFLVGRRTSGITQTEERAEDSTTQALGLLPTD